MKNKHLIFYVKISDLCLYGFLCISDKVVWGVYTKNKPIPTEVLCMSIICKLSITRCCHF